MNKIAYHHLLETMGKNLHTIRNARKETLQGVASTLGFTHPVLSKIENGKYENVPLQVLVKLCNHYNVSLQQCMELELAQILPLTQHYKGGNQLLGQEYANGFEIALQQYQEEIKFLRELLLDKSQNNPPPPRSPRVRDCSRKPAVRHERGLAA